MDDVLDDVAFLSTSAHRAAVLDALADGHRDRVALREETGASDPTIGRVLGDLEARGWIERDGDPYRVTARGAYVAEHFSTLLDRLRTERRLRGVWRWLPSDLPGFRVDLFEDAVVTAASAEDPFAPDDRCASFYPGTTRVRGFDAVLTSPRSFERLVELVVDGLEVEFVLTAAVAATLHEAYPEHDRRARASDHVSLHLNEALPLCRLTIFDDRVGVGGYDPDTGMLAVYLDSDAQTLREWAVQTFERYRAGSRPAAPDVERTSS